MASHAALRSWLGRSPSARSRGGPRKPDLERLEERQLLSAAPGLPDSLHFDFGTATSPVAPGYVAVTPVVYSAARGYGWQSTSGITAVDGGTADPLTRDFHRGRSGTFLVDLPNGAYQVTAVLGGASTPLDRVNLRAEGQLVASRLSGAARQTVESSFQVNVQDGRLNLQIADQGGKNPYFTIAALHIDPVRPAPVAGAGADLTVPEGSALSFAGNASGSGTLSYHWDFGDGNGVSGTLTPTHVYRDNGTYTVTLTVTDAFGATAMDTAAVTVGNVSPTVQVGGPYGGLAGTPVSFGATVTDPGANDTAAGFTYLWDFGDGGISSEANPSHAFEAPGTYTVSVTVFDKDGAFGTDSKTFTATVTSTGANRPPVLQPIADQAVPSSQDIITVPLSATDPDGDPITLAATAQSLAYVLDQQLGLADGGSVWDNWGGRGEKWLLDSAGAWYFIVPNGELYLWDGSGPTNLTGTLVGNVGASYHANLALLYNAVANQPHAALGIAGGTLTIDREDGFVGAVVITVTASDDRGGTATTSVQVDGITPALSVNAGPDRSGNEGAAVSFNGTASGGAGGLSHLWDFGDGNSASGTLTPSHAYRDNGSYTVTLTVTDTAGKSRSDTAVVNVANVAPTPLPGGPYAGSAGTPIAFMGNATDVSQADTQAGFTYRWDFGDGTTSNQRNPSKTYAAAGTFAVRLTVTDKDGASATSQTTAAISAAPVPLSVNAGPDRSGNEGSVVSFNGTSSGGAGGLSHLWDFGDGNSASGTLTPSHAYRDNGSYTVTLTVTDAAGQSRTDTAVVNVANVAPTPLSGGPYAGTAAASIAFSGNATDVSQADTQAGFSYRWDFGDGTTSSQRNPSKTYAAAGTFTVQLTVTDKDGASATTQTTAAISAAPAQGVLRTFTLQETFGVSHPRQLIELDPGQPINPAAVYLLGPDGQPAPFQLLQNGRLAVLADLPAYGQRTWTLYGGPPPATPAVAGAVAVTQGQGYYEISNGLTGVRVPLPAADLHQPLAPIQGLLYRDGTWTATGPNYLHSRSWYENPLAPPPAQEMTVRFLERGPLKVVVEIAYRFDRPDFYYGEQLLIPGGDGYYRTTIELQADQPSILVEEDGDVDIGYSLDIHDGLAPDQARYRGHHASAAEYGREPDGSIYRPWNERAALDATIDLEYDHLTKVSYNVHPEEGVTTRPPLAIWNPWAYDSGWYWQLYNSQAGAAANLFGLFAGPPSRAIGANASGVGVFNGPGPDGSPSAGITVELNRSDPSLNLYPRNRFAWGIFLGEKGPDLRAPDEVQTVGEQMNLHGGFNLDKVQHYQLDFADPPAGYGALYMDREALDRLIQRVRTDDSYYAYLYNAEPTFRPVLDLWRDTTGTQLRAVVQSITDLAHDLLDVLVNGNGIYDFRFHYWHGGLEMDRMGLWIDQVLASDQLTPEDRTRVKAAAALFANVLWDDDFVPFQQDAGGQLRHGLNLGTANMPVQHQNYRDFYALFLGADPAWRGRAAEVRDRALNVLHHVVNEDGAAIGSTGYVAASLAPTLNTLLRVQRLGGDDPFQSEPRLARFAEFFLNLLSPPDPRYGNLRKVVAIGDGATEGSSLYGVLATGFRASNPLLSARLMGAWQAEGKPHSGFFGSTLLKIDEQAPAADPALGSANFPGYYSVLRSGWGTPEETALWFVNGDFYSDHRTSDHGSVVLYALGAPLSLNWGSLYYPHVSGAFQHSAVLPESQIGSAWNQDGSPLDAGGAWGGSVADGFAAFPNGAYARAHFTAADGTVWTRTLYLVQAGAAGPVFVFQDSFAGPGANASKVFSLNLLAEGAVETPMGTVYPEKANGAYGELPSAGEVLSLQAGVNQFGFTGQTLIDWDVYTLSSGTQEALIGSWGHNWSPVTESSEFSGANGGEAFQVEQEILRLRSDEQFTVVLVPHHKGAASDVQVTQSGSAVVIVSGNEKTVIDSTFYSYEGRQQVLATFGPEAASAAGISIAGGGAEVVVDGSTATITLHGDPGQRTITLPPGTWVAPSLVSAARGQVGDSGPIQLDYQGGVPISVTLVKV